MTTLQPLFFKRGQKFNVKISCQEHGEVEINVTAGRAGLTIAGARCPFAHVTHAVSEVRFTHDANFDDPPLR